MRIFGGRGEINYAAEWRLQVSTTLGSIVSRCVFGVIGLNMTRITFEGVYAHVRAYVHV